MFLPCHLHCICHHPFTFFFFSVLLACISCTGVFHCDIYICTYSVSLLDSSPPSFSFIPPSVFWEQSQQISLFYFHTCIQNISMIFAPSL
jgi:hypothetical protein